MNELTESKIEVIQSLLIRLLQANEDGFVNKQSGVTDIDVNTVLNAVSKFRRSIARTRAESSHPGYQYKEGLVIEALLTEPAEQCSYVDVGASYPKECSNTWSLYCKGWRGLLIEPLPHCWPSILQERPGDYLFPVAVSDTDGFAEFRIAGELSTLRDDWPIVDQATLTVETRTLSRILEDFPAIRDKCKFCSIDVEGYERQVLLGTDFSSFRPDLFIIEFRKHHPRQPGVSLTHEWMPLLQEHGYVPIDCSRLNLLLLHERKMDRWNQVKNQVQMTPDDYLQQCIA
jgi:FkbM family methyltransferase